MLWQYRDEDNQNIDVIPAGRADRAGDYAGQELQAVNYGASCPTTAS